MHIAVLNNVKINLTLQYLLSAVFGVCIIALFAQIRIPIEPVPITLQTVAVMFIGYKFSPNQTLSATTLYILLGILGVPIFCDYSYGIEKVIGPSGGYLIGFVPSAYILASLKNRFSDTWLNMLVIGMIASAIVFIFGISWLAYLTSIKYAIQYGFLPFIIPGIIKVIALVSLLRIFKAL